MRNASFTLERWGRAQTRRYVRQLRAACRRLSNYPLLDTPCDHLRPGLRRSQQDRHVIFYDLTGDGIRVVRILHQAMAPSQHIMGEH